MRFSETLLQIMVNQRKENDMDWLCRTGIDGQVEVKRRLASSICGSPVLRILTSRIFGFSAEIIDQGADCVGFAVDDCVPGSQRKEWGIHRSEASVHPDTLGFLPVLVLLSL